MSLLIYIINLFFSACFFVIILQVALNWLINFDIINVNNPQARNLVQLAHKLTDPVYRPLRRFIPAIGGIDLTPLVAMIGLNIIQQMLIGLLLQL